MDEIRRWVDRREERVMKGAKKKKKRDKVWDKVRKKSKQDVTKKGGEKEEVGFRSQSHFRHRNLSH